MSCLMMAKKVKVKEPIAQKAIAMHRTFKNQKKD